jgi:hypothetical protein
MFKKFQSDLLIKNPLIWNTRVIPFTILLVVFNLVFFLVGYNHGIIDFQNQQNYHYNFLEPIVIIFSLLTSLLVFISWALFYFKNNAFKSFYPKSSLSIFKEWLLILVICSLNLAYIPTYFYAMDLRARNYFDKTELERRCDIISKSSIFLDGSFQQGYYVDVKDEKGEWKQIRRDSFDYNNRKYSLKSLINKDFTSFPLNDDKKDSLNIDQVKKWMVNNQQDSIKNLMADFFKIINEHEIKANINKEQWFTFVYDYPEFTNYIKVGKRQVVEDYYLNDYYDDEVVEEVTYIDSLAVYNSNENIYDSISFNHKFKNGVKYLDYKHYINFKSLEHSYDKISRSWINPAVDFQFIIVYLYISLGISLLFFTFKFTSGRSWLISVITTIALGIILGVLFSLRISTTGRFGIVIGIIVGLLTYFILILKNRQTKKISAIVLNLLVWYLPILLVMIYFLTIEILKINQGYYDVDYEKRTYENFPLIENLESFAMSFHSLNLTITIIFMFFISKFIRKWKGIPES